MFITNFLNWVIYDHAHETRALDEQRHVTAVKIHAYLFSQKDCLNTLLGHVQLDAKSLARHSLLNYVHMRVDGSVPLAHLEESGLIPSFEGALHYFEELQGSLRHISTGTWETVMIILEKEMRSAIAIYKRTVKPL